MSANDKQEGGTHYKTDGIPEHWDLAIMYGWDPFQYQITKYLMRWRYKHTTPEARLTDLKKAQHFLEKYIENWEKYDIVDLSKGWEPKYTDENWTCEGFLGDGKHVFQCRHCKTEYRVSTILDAYAEHGSCASPKYVAQ